MTYANVLRWASSARSPSRCGGRRREVNSWDRHHRARRGTHTGTTCLLSWHAVFPLMSTLLENHDHLFLCPFFTMSTHQDVETTFVRPTTIPLEDDFEYEELEDLRQS